MGLGVMLSANGRVTPFGRSEMAQKTEEGMTGNMLGAGLSFQTEPSNNLGSQWKITEAVQRL